MKKMIWVVMFTALAAGMVGETRADGTKEAAKPSKDGASGTGNKGTVKGVEGFDKSKLKPAPSDGKNRVPTKDDIKAEKSGK